MRPLPLLCLKYIYLNTNNGVLPQISVDPGFQVLLGDIEETFENKIASYPPAQLSPQPSRFKLPSIGSLSINTRTSNIPVIRGVFLILTRYRHSYSSVLSMAQQKTILVIDVNTIPPQTMPQTGPFKTSSFAGLFAIINSYSETIKADMHCYLPMLKTLG